MKILVLNAGSSSLKYSVYENEELILLAKGVVEKIGDSNGKIGHKYLRNGTQNEWVVEENIGDHYQALQTVVSLLKSENHGVIKDIKEIAFVGHRVVHGGEFFSSSHLIDENLKQKVKELIPLAPLHNPPNLLGIEVSQEIFPDSIQVAVFDTAFHQTIPEYTFRYAVPDKYYKDFGIRLYGMHGTSHRYVTEETAKYLGKSKNDINLITIHLGNGCSISAIKEGKCIDTSLGFSPLPGLVMGTRSGDIDPSIIFHLIRQHRFSYQEVEIALNKESGLKGLTGLTDLRDIHKKRKEGDKSAVLALEIYCYRIKKYIGAYLAAIGALDAIVFTAGVGENDEYVRANTLKGLGHLGITVDSDKNERSGSGIREIHQPGSNIKLLVVPTDEEKQIALSTLKFHNQN
ncbi:MAG: acetate kinase [Saprospiraceae bacterium]|nr:acetate kinase [Saprospiraceae bacterium]